jgi:hypothetical protein
MFPRLMGWLAPHCDTCRYDGMRFRWRSRALRVVVRELEPIDSTDVQDGTAGVINGYHNNWTRAGQSKGCGRAGAVNRYEAKKERASKEAVKKLAKKVGPSRDNLGRQACGYARNRWRLEAHLRDRTRARCRQSTFRLAYVPALLQLGLLRGRAIARPSYKCIDGATENGAASEFLTARNWRI